MPYLFWAIQWDWGVYTVNNTVERELIKQIRKRVNGHQISPDDVGRFIERIPLVIEGTETSFSARLERIDPLATFTVGPSTDVQIRLVTDLDNMKPGRETEENMEPSLTRDIDDLVMFQTIFNPVGPISHYMEIYNSLVGIPKDLILREMVTLCTPFEEKERWSRRHYGKLLPALKTTAQKAPVIVLGGDPGTGKTAVATSIGAPLAQKIGERVHFRHLSLLLRGMGYQGRASGMLVKLFEHIKKEYTELQEPMILFFDEAEAVVGVRRGTDSSSGAQENIAIVDAVIVGVDSLRKGLQARVIALFATNLTGRIDSALMRRSYYHYFDRPDEKIRRELFCNSLKGTKLEVDLEMLVHETAPRMVNGVEVQFTHSDIVELIVGRALDEAVRRNEPLDTNLLVEYCRRTNPTTAV